MTKCGMDCPRCGAELITQTLDGRQQLMGDRGPFRSNPNLNDELQRVGEAIWVERCSGCQGIWFDRSELAEAMRSMEIMDVPDPPSGLSFGPNVPGPCPRCRAPMGARFSRVVPGVVYNVCGSCNGIWLDAGEVLRFAHPLVALSSFICAEFGGQK